MDKHDSEKGVTIKINGKEKAFVEKAKFQIEEGQDEAATVESGDESLDWILPNEMTPSLIPKKVNMHHKDRRKVQLRTPFILAIVAIVFGTSLGIIVIRTITAEQSVAQPVEQSIPAVAPPPTESKTESMNVQTFLVQGGVYSTEDAAKEVQANIHQKNLPAEVIQIEKNYYVFLGTAENLEATKELALIYKTYDVDVFWKEMNFEMKRTEGDKEFDKVLFVYTSLAELSSSKLRQVDSSLDINKITEQLNAIQLSEHKEAKEPLSEAAKLLKKDKPSEAQTKLLTFLQIISQ